MIALYMRLSRADGDLEGEGAVSNSIANQRAILRSFVECVSSRLRFSKEQNIFHKT